MDEHRGQRSPARQERDHALHGSHKKKKKQSFLQKIRQIDPSKGNWWQYHLKGFVSVAFGAILIIWPEESLRFLIIVMGIQALVKGGIGLVHALSLAKKQEKWGLILLEGLAGLILGVIIITRPEASIKTAAVLIGIWMIATGLGQLAIAIADSSKVSRGLIGAGGLLSIIIGALIVFVPMETVELAHTLSAIQALALGIIFIVVGSYMLLRSHKHRPEDAFLKPSASEDGVHE